MPVYTVHEPLRRDDELLAHTARFRFVRDGFHFWAFLLAPVWMLRHRLWLELIAYALVVGAATFALRRFGIEERAGFWVALLLALLVGIEASSLLRWKLTRRGYENLGVVVAVRQKGRPFLGICVGMQLMAERGREYEVVEGLGWIPGEVDRITPSDPDLKIPHMGWNTLNQRKPHPLLEGIPLGASGLHGYFVHSYQLNTNEDCLVADADYGGLVTAIVARETTVGTQFHPEKSQKLGLALISNFLKWKP